MQGVIRGLREAVRQQKALRAARLPSKVILWSPDPVGLVQSVRQAWCFLTSHKWESYIHEDGPDHKSMVNDCLRCGLVLSNCLECESLEA